ncbi:ictacalcin-like [Symphorus nematophorus]
MTDVEKAMCMLITAFHKYSGKEGDKYNLTKAELKDLLQNELGPLLGKANDKETVDKIFSDLDSNSDGIVDFTEYIRLVGAVTMVCNEFFTKQN